jgi:hypothetical protein
MAGSRQQHGCGRITRNGHDYIAVIEGRLTDADVPTASIHLYNLSTRPNAWESVVGLSLPYAIYGIMGSLVKQLDVKVCSAMIISISSQMVAVCSGNYEWSYYYFSDYGATKWSQLAAVDASFLGGSKI